MKRYSQFEKILNEPITSIEKIENGLTNENYHVISKNYDVVFRVPKPENKGLFDFKLEGKIIASIKSLQIDVPLVSYNETTGIKITQFIPNTRHFTIDNLERSATLLKTLHDADLQSGTDFHLWYKYNLYKSRVKDFKYDLTEYEDLVHEAEASITHRVLCHNDVVEGNLLFTDSEAYLIDYEYASDNDPFFDIMSLLTENDIQDPSQRAIFYKAYFGSLPDKHTQQRLELFEKAHYVLWCCWAQMMMSTDSNPIYEDIADLKYKRLQEKTTRD